MADLNFRITNLGAFEVSLQTGLAQFTDALFRTVVDYMSTVNSAVIKHISTHEDFLKLRTDEILRGQLGLAKNSFKVGGDTDAEDLLKALETGDLKVSFAGGNKRLTLNFPSIAQLSDKLTHSFTRLKNGTPQGGPTVSWFAWWEFGNRGEVDSATIFRFNAPRMRGGKTISKDKVNRIIEDTSRSGSAIQLRSLPPNSKSFVQAHRVVYNTYKNFAQILPARIGGVLRRFSRSKDINSYFRNI